MLRRATLFTLLAALSVGCASLLDLEEFQIVHDAGDAAAAGGSGGEATAGSAGDGAEGNAAGTASGGSAGTGGSETGGDGGSSGTAGTGGTGGSDGGTAGAAGTAGTSSGPTGCDGVTPFTPNMEIVQSCVLRYSCNPFYPDDTISNCVTLNVQKAYPGTSVRCTIDATSCLDVAACEGYGFALDDLCLGESGSRCQDTIAVDCDQGTFHDCALYGGTCTVQPDGTADCQVLDSCTPSTVDRCGGTANQSLYSCVDGVGYGIHCPNFGATCQNRDGVESCIYDAATCSDLDVIGCTGNLRRSCSAFGELRNYDCPSVGLSCADAECLAPGCTPNDIQNCVESCSDRTLNFCYGGVGFSVDCGDYGFPTCGEYTHPDGWEFATCSY